VSVVRMDRVWRAREISASPKRKKIKKGAMQRGEFWKRKGSVRECSFRLIVTSLPALVKFLFFGFSFCSIMCMNVV
jgi:hypothetical protein